MPSQYNCDYCNSTLDYEPTKEHSCNVCGYPLILSELLKFVEANQQCINKIEQLNSDEVKEVSIFEVLQDFEEYRDLLFPVRFNSKEIIISLLNTHFRFTILQPGKGDKIKDAIKEKSDLCFIFHKERYLADSIAQALGYSQDAYLPLQNPDELIARLTANPSLLLISGDSPDDLKTILDEVLGRRLNKTPVVILTTLSQESLVKRLNREDCFPEFKNFKNEGIFGVIKLPQRITDIKTEIESIKRSYQNNESRCIDIRKTIAKRLAETQDKDQRHRMGNLMAASRILNGTLMSGDYDLLDPQIEDRAMEVYRKLISVGKDLNGNPWTVKEKKDREKDAIKTVTEAKNKLDSDKKVSSGWYLNIKNILIIDDEHEIWEPVWQFLFGEDKITFTTSLSHIDNEKSRDKTGSVNAYDLVILDINLGEGQSNGINILQAIKRRQFDLPIIMTTACDNAELAKLCLKMGAHGYFLKELKEEERDSVKYYIKLKELIQNIIPYKSEERHIWREFVAIEDRINDTDKKCGTQIGHFFRKAYYFLIMDDKYLLPKTLLIPEWLQNSKNPTSTRYEGVSFNAVYAADQIFIAKLMITKNINYDNGHGKIFDPTTDDQGRPEYPKFEERMKRAVMQVSDIKRLKVSSNRHAFVIGRGEQTACDKKSACSCLQELIHLMKQLLRTITQYDNSLSEDKSQAEKTQDIDISTYLSKTSIDIGHEDRSLMSAKCLQDGFDMWISGCKSILGISKNSGKVLFVDDEGESSAWYGPLQQILNFRGIDLTCIRALPDNLKEYLRDYKLVLLDLMFMKEQNLVPTGIKEYLDEIKKEDLSIPVIMLTSDDSAFFARRCLLHGADDYFVKAPIDNALDYYNSFSRMINKYLEPSKENNLRRSWWHEVEKLKNCYFGLDLNNGRDDRWNRLRKFKNNVFARNDEKLLELIQQLIRFPLREAYFYYLLMSFEEMFVDLWRIKRLLVSDNCRVDILLCFGQLVECLILQLYEVQEEQSSKKVKAGYFIKKLNYPIRYKPIFNKFWKLRNKAKMGEDTVNDGNIANLFDEIIPAVKEFEFRLQKCR